jgi:hypothetical protein
MDLVSSFLINDTTVFAYLEIDHDSYYEYMQKLFVLTNGLSKALIDRHIMTLNEYKRQAIGRSNVGNHHVIPGILYGKPNFHIEHLSTLFPASVAVDVIQKKKLLKILN